MKPFQLISFISQVIPSRIEGIEEIETDMVVGLWFLSEDLPSKQLQKHKYVLIDDGIEALIIEVNLRKTKFIFLGAYRPTAQSHHYCLKKLVMP